MRKGLGRYIITNQKDKLYQSSSEFTKKFKNEFDDYTPYDLRKAVSSRCIALNDIEKNKTLEHNQGHSLQIVLENYNVYSIATKRKKRYNNIINDNARLYERNDLYA